MSSRPHVEQPTQFGAPPSFWVEYPNGLVDVSRSTPLPTGGFQTPLPARKAPSQIDIPVDGNRAVRLEKTKTALIVIDMQNYFLHPDIRDHPTGLACVDPLVQVVPALRSRNIKIIWVNWGLTDHELKTIPPSLERGFMKGGSGGFGSELPGNFGRLLMRDALNSQLYGPLQPLYLEGKAKGTDVWIHKNRMSGLWGPQTALDLYLQEEGITTLLFSGVNADQCVLGTLVDSYYRGYDCILVSDITATTSPEGGLENVLYNAGRSYGFTTDTKRIIKTVENQVKEDDS